MIEIRFRLELFFLLLVIAPDLFVADRDRHAGRPLGEGGDDIIPAHLFQRALNFRLFIHTALQGLLVEEFRFDPVLDIAFSLRSGRSGSGAGCSLPDILQGEYRLTDAGDDALLFFICAHQRREGEQEKARRHDGRCFHKAGIRRNIRAKFR